MAVPSGSFESVEDVALMRRPLDWRIFQKVKWKTMASKSSTEMPDSFKFLPWSSQGITSHPHTGQPLRRNQSLWSSQKGLQKIYFKSLIFKLSYRDIGNTLVGYPSFCSKLESFSFHWCSWRGVRVPFDESVSLRTIRDDWKMIDSSLAYFRFPHFLLMSCHYHNFY